MAIFRSVPLRNGHSFPNAVFFLPVVERLAVDLVDGSLCDAQLFRPEGHEEINVIGFAIDTFHIDAGEVLVPTETGEAIIMDLDQIEREISASIPDMKLFVGRFSGRGVDVFLKSARNIGLAHCHGLGGGSRGARSCLWQLLELRLLWRARMFAGEYCDSRCEQQGNGYSDSKSCDHRFRRFINLIPSGSRIL